MISLYEKKIRQTEKSFRLLDTKNKNILFVIFLHIGEKKRMTGGLLACHRLAYELAVRGFKVMIFCEPLMAHENIIVNQSTETWNENGSFSYSWNSFSYVIDETVVIYPEIYFSNPIGCKNVVRWLLYKPTIEVESTFGENDYIFYYGDHNIFNQSKNRELTVFYRNLDKLYNSSSTNKKGYCHIMHKKTPDDLSLLNELNSVDISKWKDKGFEYFREEVSKYEYFLTYDDQTYYTIMAALCGTIPIIIPQDDRLPLEYRQQNLQQFFGVAYGFDDIDWAKKTIHLVRDYEIQKEQIEQKTVENFINFFIEEIYYKNE